VQNRSDRDEKVGAHTKCMPLGSQLAPLPASWDIIQTHRHREEYQVLRASKGRANAEANYQKAKNQYIQVTTSQICRQHQTVAPALPSVVNGRGGGGAGKS